MSCPDEKPDVVAAKSVSLSMCRCGTVYVRLHNKQGQVFAAGGLDPDVAIAFAEEAVRLATIVNRPRDTLETIVCEGCA